MAVAAVGQNAVDLLYRFQFLYGGELVRHVLERVVEGRFQPRRAGENFSRHLNVDAATPQKPQHDTIDRYFVESTRQTAQLFGRDNLRQTVAVGLAKHYAQRKIDGPTDIADKFYRRRKSAVLQFPDNFEP